MCWLVAGFMRLRRGRREGYEEIGELRSLGKREGIGRI